MTARTDTIVGEGEAHDEDRQIERTNKKGGNAHLLDVEPKKDDRD